MSIGKQVCAVLTLAVLVFGDSLLSQTKGALEWLTFEQAMEKAKLENRKVLVDVYTDWCGWCKKMDKEVYADPGVVEVLSQYFVVAKLNAESSKDITYKGTKLTERRFAAGAGVSGYPSTIFFESDSKPITLLPGFVPAPRFITILRYIGENHYRTISFEEYVKKSGTAQ